MRKVLSVAAGALLMVGLAAPVASASTHDVSQTINVKAVRVTDVFHGRTDSFTERLMQNGNTVGHDAVTCTFNFSTGTARCIGVVIFPGAGDLFVTATSSANQNGATGRVVGGTGAYTGANGTLMVVGGNGKVSWVTLRFHL